jgi:hypothetical protein
MTWREYLEKKRQAAANESMSLGEKQAIIARARAVIEKSKRARAEINRQRIEKMETESRCQSI